MDSAFQWNRALRSRALFRGVLLSGALVSVVLMCGVLGACNVGDRPLQNRDAGITLGQGGEPGAQPPPPPGGGGSEASGGTGSTPGDSRGPSVFNGQGGNGASAGGNGGTGDISTGGTLAALDSGLPPVPGDTTPPSLVSVTPAEGTSQVTEEAITLAFSEPMDRASVEAAFPTATAFRWSEADSRVRIELPLPFAPAPALFDIQVPASVSDVAGNTLATPFEASIVLAAVTLLNIPHNGDLTGNQVAGQNGNFTFFEAGDTAAGALHYGAVSFSLAELPAVQGTLGLRRATLRLQVIDIAGDPNAAALGGFLLDRASFAARADIDDPTILEPAFTSLVAPAGFAPGQPVFADITAQVQGAWVNAEALLQFRIRAGASSANQIADAAYFRRGADENNSIVAVGVTDPDPANIARIELEYFE